MREGENMNIFKALKKEKKFIKRFYIIMIALLVILPLSVYLTSTYNTFIIVCLLFIELLIILTILIKTNYMKLTYSCNNNRLKCKSGLFSKESLLFCDKVILVHTEKMEEDMEIYIFTTVNIKNKGLKLVGKSLIKRAPSINENLKKIKKSNEGKLIFYQVIRKGGLEKYMLLDTIYKNCVKATYTSDCIQNIKIARGQTLV